MSEEKKEAAPEAAAVAEAPKAEAKAEKSTTLPLEAHFPDRDLKAGDVFLKRKDGKPRWRKISAKDYVAKLFNYVNNEWVQKTARGRRPGQWHDLRWHLNNNWEKTEKFTAPVRPPKKEKPAAEAAPAA